MDKKKYLMNKCHRLEGADIKLQEKPQSMQYKEQIKNSRNHLKKEFYIEVLPNQNP